MHTHYIAEEVSPINCSRAKAPKVKELFRLLKTALTVVFPTPAKEGPLAMNPIMHISTHVWRGAKGLAGNFHPAILARLRQGTISRSLLENPVMTL